MHVGKNQLCIYEEKAVWLPIQQSLSAQNSELLLEWSVNYAKNYLVHSFAI